MKLMRKLAHVPRWTVVQTIQEESVAEHSYKVSCYSLAFGRSLRFNAAKLGHLMAMALAHDLEEAITGDIPSPVEFDKRKYRNQANNIDGNWWKINQLPDGVKKELGAVVKLADLLDMYLFLRREIHLGNSSVTDLSNSLKAKLLTQKTKIDGTRAFDRVFDDLVATGEDDQQWIAL